METGTLIQALTDPRDHPEHPVSPDDELRLLIAAGKFLGDLCTALASHTTNSPTRAALLAFTVENVHKTLDYAQLQAAKTAQGNLVHELPAGILTELRAIGDAPGPYLQGETALPADPRTVPTGLLAFRDTTEFLQRTLAISHFDAKARIHAAFALLPGTDVFRNPKPPRYPILAEQLRSGAARVKPTAAAARKLDKLRPGIQKQPGPDDLGSRIEEQVAQSVKEETSRNTKRLLDALGDELDGAATAPTVEEIRAKTGVFITKRTRNFTYMNVCMLNLDAEVFLSHFAQTDNPRTLAGNRDAMAAAATHPGPANANGTTETQDGPDWFTKPADAATFETPAPAEGYDFGEESLGIFNTTDPGADGLTPPQRHLQTLLNLMRTPKNGSAKGTTGLPTAQLVVYVHLETLLGLARGTGWSAHGLEIPIGEIRRRLSTDGVIPVVLGGQSEVLDVGRGMRFAPDYMKRAVLARDGGCIYPGCSVPPEHCEFCHVEAWADGGTTSVEGLTPGCTKHHHMFDTGEAKLVIHDGLPHVILPKYLDPEQKPVRNTYWPGPQTPLF
ncbi:HNH endonuclease signature motif containing protein [Paeniglutamicibacter sp. NPDC091659]|uniref:HNH endonuclease signature motif containing protein n=1 Tax=Paeniglutamicibacter sp. NPDC091659 TaxID=3364389 RepID=UPI0038142572